MSVCMPDLIMCTLAGGLKGDWLWTAAVEHPDDITMQHVRMAYGLEWPPHELGECTSSAVATIAGCRPVADHAPPLS